MSSRGDTAPYRNTAHEKLLFGSPRRLAFADFRHSSRRVPSGDLTQGITGVEASSGSGVTPCGTASRPARPSLCGPRNCRVRPPGAELDSESPTRSCPVQEVAGFLPWVSRPTFQLILTARQHICSVAPERWSRSGDKDSEGPSFSENPQTPTSRACGTVPFRMRYSCSLGGIPPPRVTPLEHYVGSRGGRRHPCASLIADRCDIWTTAQ